MLTSQIYTVFDIEDSDYLVRDMRWDWTTIQVMILPILFILALLVFIFAALSIARSVRKMAENSERLLSDRSAAVSHTDFTQDTEDQRLGN